MSSAYTFYFEDIFPDYNAWRDVMEGNNVLDYTNAENVLFDQFCYRILARQFTHCNIRYSTPNDFIGTLINVYLNKFEQFKRQKAIIDATYQLTLDDIAEIEKTITNMANNPNTDIPLSTGEVLPYLSAQTFNLTSSNRLKSYIDAINNLPTLNIFKFLKGDKNEIGFEDLFMSVQPYQEYLFKKGV